MYTDYFFFQMSELKINNKYRKTEEQKQTLAVSTMIIYIHLHCLEGWTHSVRMGIQTNPGSLT